MTHNDNDKVIKIVFFCSLIHSSCITDLTEGYLPMIEKLFSSGRIDRRWISRQSLDSVRSYYMDTVENDISDCFGPVNQIPAIRLYKGGKME